MPQNQLLGDSIACPDLPAQMVELRYEVPENASVPTDAQIRRSEIIRAEFGRIWKDAVEGLQRKFEEVGEDQQAAEAVVSACVFISEPDDEETDEDFYWCIGIDIRERKPWQGWQINFLGKKFNLVVFYP